MLACCGEKLVPWRPPLESDHLVRARKMLLLLELVRQTDDVNIGQSRNMMPKSSSLPHSQLCVVKVVLALHESHYSDELAENENERL